MAATVSSVRSEAQVSVVKPVASVSVVLVGSEVTYQLPASVIEYILLTVSATLDESGRYPYVKDSAVLVDAIVLDFAKGLADSSDAIEELRTELERALEESLSIEDVVEILITIIREFSDDAFTTDESNISTDKGLVDSVINSDVRAIEFSKAITDISSAIDSARSALSKPESDIAVAEDAIGYLVNKLEIDSVSTSESSDRDFNKGSSDSISVLDSFSYTITTNASQLLNSYTLNVIVLNG